MISYFPLNCGSWDIEEVSVAVICHVASDPHDALHSGLTEKRLPWCIRQ